MANQSPSSLFLDQGQGFWGALKERYPWLTPAQIQDLLPQVQAMNPNITDIGIGYPGEPYNIPYIPKPPGYIRSYSNPEDVVAYGQQEEDKKRAFFAMTEADQLADIQKEYDLTSRVANMGRAFNVRTSAGGQVATSGSTADRAKGVAKQSANRKFFEDLMAFSQQVGGRITGDELRKFMTDSGAGEDQMKALKNSGMWEYLNLGDIVPMYSISPNGKLETSWHYKNDAADIQIQRNSGKTLNKDAATLKRGLEVDSDIVTATGLVMDAGITDYEKWKEFREKHKVLLDRSPKILAAVKELVPDEIWKTGDMETLFRIDNEGKITSKDFDKGSRAYNKALGPVKNGEGGWSKTLEAVKANESLKFEALMAETLRENPGMAWPALKLQIQMDAQHIRMSPEAKVNALDKWWDQESRTAETLATDKSLLNQFLNTRPRDMDTLRININKLNNGKGVSAEASTWFWEQMDKRYPYPDSEPRTLWNPSTGESIDVENYWEKNNAFGDGFTSSTPVDLTPMAQQRMARRHVPITKVLGELDSDAETWWYQGEELTLDQANAFFEKYPRGIKRFTEKGERLFVDEVRGRVKPLLEKHDKSTKEIGTIIQSARQGGAGHVALLNTVVRMYDELGAVRESDISLVQALAPWRDSIEILWRKNMGNETLLLSDTIVEALEAIAYTTWRMKAEYTREQLRGIQEDFNQDVLPSAYPLGEAGEEFGYGTDKIVGEGTKISWTKAAGNRAAELESGAFTNPYEMANKVPLDVAKYVLSNTELIKELEDMGAGNITATSLGTTESAVDRAKKWGYTR